MTSIKMTTLTAIGLCACLYSAPAIAKQTQSAAKPLLPDAVQSISDWFAADANSTPDIPGCIEELDPVKKEDLHAVRDMLWQTYQQSPAGQALKETLPAPFILKGNEIPSPPPHALKTGDKVMPFYFLGKGNLEGPRPLFIALHGGGSAGGRAPSPHGWPVNTQEWNTQALLAAKTYPSDALYFVPRMADDNDGRWYYHYCQDAYDRVVRAAILHHNVDPNRVYLIGISEGAYTAYRLGAFMADRWAGAGSMAGGEPLNNAPPENMRNLAFRADIGEKDTMFDRVGLNQRYAKALGKLKQDDPNGFTLSINVQPGRGHGIDYKPCPEWLFQHQRNPWPQRIQWKVIRVHGRRKEQFYWLAMDAEPPVWPVYIDARIDAKTNTIHITIKKEDENGKRIQTDEIPLRCYLNDQLIDFARPVTVVRNSQQVFSGPVSRRVDVMMRSLAERGDPCYIFPAEIAIPQTPDTKAGGDTASALVQIPQTQRKALIDALGKAGPNRGELLGALQSVRDQHAAAAAFLIINMPQCDRLQLKKDFLTDQVELAYETWKKSPWGKDIPEQLFLQYILPYVNLNERRDNWRRDFMERLREKAWLFESPIEATIWLNNELNDIFKVYYHATKRPKPDQSPYESIEAGYASCTGLSILLADCCRSVGIPARIVGVPRWTQVQGNHNWVEIWDGQWYNVGGTGSDPRDDDWVNERCLTQTDPDQWFHSIYAASFRQTNLHFPLVWDMDNKDVPALNITRFYSAKKEVAIDVPGDGRGVVEVFGGGEIIARRTGEKSVPFTLATGSQYDIRITTADGKIHQKILRL
ncbi:MAG: transglutaminase domain-containing protein [Planctomycetota bacterium]